MNINITAYAKKKNVTIPESKSYRHKIIHKDYHKDNIPTIHKITLKLKKKIYYKHFKEVFAS